MKGVVAILKAVVLWALLITFTFGSGALLLLIFVLAGADKRAAKAATKLESTLMPGEQLIQQAAQHRAFALFSRRLIVAITNSRIITMKRGLLGGFKMIDIQWKDLKDVTLEQNVLDGLCGSNLKFVHLNRGVPQIAVDGVPNAPAARMYAHAQAEEQAWEEKRRIRGIEEVRAASGGVHVSTQQPASPEPRTAAPGNRMLEEIQKAKALFDSGAVSDAEFQEMKAKILASA